MILTEAYKATRILEAVDNYSKSDQLHTVENNDPPGGGGSWLDTERLFWRAVLDKPEKFWGKEFMLSSCILSEWVPRVPGLFWTRGSDAIRGFAEKEIVANRPGYIEYNPIGKSQKVLGGVGTLKLSPDQFGNQLFSVSFSGNVSVGIPILLSVADLDALKIRQGNLVDIKSARWEKMSLDWARQFPSTANIPRGYLRITQPTDIINKKETVRYECHPFSIMEYQDGNSLLFDFVFVTSINSSRDNRKRIETFFKNYQKKQGRDGTYLFSCDMANPLFDSKYASPADMRSDYENGQMALLEARVRMEYFNGHTVDELIKELPGLYQTAAAVRTLTSILELPVGLLRDDAAAKMSSQLIEMCINKGKLESLIDRMAYDHPQAFAV